jgi:hypothetical protein
MRRALTLALALLLTTPLARAQDAPPDFGSFPMGNLVENGNAFGLLGGGTNVFTSAFGASIIDGEAYVGLRLQPELAIGKVGVGLDVPLMFSPESGDIRTEEFEDGVGFLRVIRYLRYGQKRSDPLYFRVGDISGTTLGFGFGMYQYSNVGSFEKRPIGLEFDVNMGGAYGLEGVYSDFSEAGVIGVRPYVRPFIAAGASLPILRNLEVGVFYLTDRSDQAGRFVVETGAPPCPPGEGGPVIGDECDPQQRTVDYGSVGIWGGDIGLPVALGSLLRVVPYAAFAQFSGIDDDAAGFEAGAGAALGVNAELQLVANVASLSAKLERRFFGDHFVGSYFDATYEANKLGGTPPILQLASSQGEDATVGALYGHVLNKVTLGGTLLIPSEVQRGQDGEVVNGSFLRLEALAPDVIPNINAAAVYNRRFIENLDDAIRLDERSTMQARLGYRLNRFMVTGVDYRWTFIPVEDEATGEERIEASSFVFPFAALSFDLSGLGRE